MKISFIHIHFNWSDKMLKDITVLITAAGNVFMPGTTACLKNNGERNIRLVGADMNDDPTMLEMVDAYYPVPRGDDPTYVDVLLDICKKEKVDVVLPIMSVELEALSKKKESFEAVGTRVSVSPIAPLEIANDKLKLLGFMKENGMPCAEFRAVKTIPELVSAVAELGYPEKKVCVKATNGSGSRGFRILNSGVSRYDGFFHDKPSSSELSIDEFISILSERETFPELMVMEYLAGDEYTVDALAEEGKVLCCCCRKSLRMENSIMLDSLVVSRPDIEAMCTQVIENLGLDGNIGFDIRERRDGEAFIMECNPRITAGIPVFYYAGVNLPYLCVKKVLGEELTVTQPRFGTIVRRRWKEMPV